MYRTYFQGTVLANYQKAIATEQEANGPQFAVRRSKSCQGKYRSREIPEMDKSATQHGKQSQIILGNFLPFTLIFRWQSNPGNIF